MVITKQKEQKNQTKQEIPYYHKPTHLTYEEWQKALRRQFGQQQKFRLKNTGSHPIFSDFEVTNPQSKKTYKVAIRSEEEGLNFCSCPDFAVNTLGTCKHIEFTLHKLKKQKNAKQLLRQGFVQPYSSVFLKYGAERKVILRIGAVKIREISALAAQYFDENRILLPEAFDRFEKFAEAAIKFDSDFRCYNDALDFIIDVRDNRRRKQLIAQKYPDGPDCKRFDHLVKTKLYCYQKEGILFAAAAGRALIADDMGLGKTVQAIGAVELMAKEFGIEKILIICPTSLKYQWEAEIKKFAYRSTRVIEGGYFKRQEQYLAPSFYKIVSYNSIRSDLGFIAGWTPDMVILDEAQRIKNWKTKTAQSVKNISSTYALVLTGTPLENRLEELHSVVQFIDRYKLGPLFRFLANHQMLDIKGKVVGYRNLNQIGETLSDILIRRNKKDVLTQLPGRMDKNFFVPITEQQWEIHEENAKTASRLIHKWARYKFLTEKERRILLAALNCMRMVCNTTFILDESTNYGTKLDELTQFLGEALESKEKVVVFSQWERMTRLVAQRLTKHKIGFLSLHGGVPSHKRKDLLDKFRNDDQSRVFLSTHAGGVGLNLQSASIVVNLDLPWNPAVLEQRIGRVHRLGQHKPVRVVNFVSEASIEQNMLEVLRFKKSLFAGALDNGMDSVFIGKSRIGKFMESVEKLTGSVNNVKDESLGIAAKQELKTENDVYSAICAAGASLLKAFTGGVAQGAAAVEKDLTTGKPCLKLPLPDRQAIGAVLPAVESLLSVLKRYVAP